MNTLALKIYNATLWLYGELYERSCAYGLTEEENRELIDLFMSASQQARNLLDDFRYDCLGERTNDIDTLVDFAIEKKVILYAKHWKSMYHGLRKRIEGNRLMPNDKRFNLFSGYKLLSNLDVNRSMRNYIEEETEESFLTPSLEIADKVQEPPWGSIFKTEIECKVLLSLQEEKEIEFIYFAFKDGHCYTSCEQIKPVSIRYDGNHWTLMGKVRDNDLHEYNVSLILSVEDSEIRGYKVRIARAFENAISNMGLDTVAEQMVP